MANNYLVFCHEVSTADGKSAAVSALILLIGNYAMDDLNGNNDNDIPSIEEFFPKEIADTEIDPSIYAIIESLFKMDLSFAQWLASLRAGNIPLDVDLVFDSDAKSLALSCEESGNIENAAKFVHFLMKAGLTAKDHEVIEYCWYCSKQRVGNFGGSAVLVTADYIRFMPSAEEWSVQELSKS